jgi:hypothetical protein
MLLDKYVLTKAFENLLSYHASTSTAQSTPPASFVKRVNQSMTRIDPLLKTLQVRPSPPEGLVQAYLIHIGDRSDTNFRKILELKGIRKQDQAHLLELFAIHRDGASASPDRPPLVQNSPLLTPLMTGSGLGSSGLAAMGGAAAVTGAGAASGLPARFDAASIGEKLLNAARDGVERMGTTGATGAAGLSTGLPATAEKATINENLKNIGKFFRRDMGGIGGLGARFGKRDITPTGNSDDSQR